MLPRYFESGLVGELTESISSPGLSFAYAPSWRQSAQSFAISLTMPLRDGAFAPEIATPWFANLLPEDRILEQVSRNLGRSQGDIFGMLKEIGREVAGALSIGEPESSKVADYRELDERQLADVIA